MALSVMSNDATAIMNPHNSIPKTDTNSNPGVVKQKTKEDVSSYEDNNLPWLKVRKINPKDVKIITYGVPDDSFLINSAFGINVNLGDVDSLFRMFKIYDVGQIKLGSVASSLSFTFVSKKNEFNSLVTNVSNYNLGIWDSIKFALMDEGFDISFSNAYGDSFLESINNVASSMLGEGMQLGFLPDLSEYAAKAAEWVRNIFGMMPFVGEKIRHSTFLNNLINQTGTISHILHADRAILPKVWKGSGMNASFSCRVLLSALTEDPRDLEERILVPITILSILATPIGRGTYWFNYPFLIKCEIEGIRKIEAGYISDLRILFGSSNSFFSTDKKYITVEVSFTVNDIFNVMVTPASAEFSNTIIPSTKKWFEYISKYIKK